MAASVIEYLREHDSIAGSPQSDVYYYFFSQVSSSCDPTGLGALKAVAFQLLQHHHEDEDLDLVDKFLFLLSHCTSGPLASRSELIDLLKLGLVSKTPNFLVFDGVDECCDSTDFLRDIKSILQHTSTRCLIFSRPDVSWMRKNTVEFQQLPITSSTNRNDIGKYVHRMVTEMIDDELLPRGVVFHNLIERLVEAANGMFLWVRLMSSYLNSSALTPAERLLTINEVELIEGLDRLYEKILKLIHQATRPRKELARRVFLWLTFAKEPLNARQLEEAITTSNEPTKSENRITDFDSAIILSCGSLVESKILFSRGRFLPTQYQFIHLSVRDYFIRQPNDSAQSSEDNLRSIYGSTLEQASLEIISTCLNYLIYRIPPRPLSGRLGVDTYKKDIDEIFPFLHYASTRWTSHLRQSSFMAKRFEIMGLQQTSATTVLKTLLEFLGKNLNLMAWVESLYIFDAAPFSFDLQQKWSLQVLQSAADISNHGTLLRRCACETADFVRDMQRMHASWSSTLRSSPCKLWGDVTAFTPSRFLGSNTFVSVIDLAPELPSTDLVSDKSLCTISQTSSDGTQLAVLRIWPSK
jgi:hypothetical protein